MKTLKNWQKTWKNWQKRKKIGKKLKILKTKKNCQKTWKKWQKHSVILKLSQVAWHKKCLGEALKLGQQSKAKAVLFIPFTNGSKLGKSPREEERKLDSMTGYMIKVVERAGDKLEELLVRTDPWQGEQCGRSRCLLCETKVKTGKHLRQCCHKRSVVYAIWC